MTNHTDTSRSGDLVKMLADAVFTGTGVMKDGKHVPIEDVYLDPRDARIEALEAENERLRGVLGLALEYWAHRQQRYKNRWPVWVQAARAALGDKK